MDPLCRLCVILTLNPAHTLVVDRVCDFCFLLFKERRYQRKIFRIPNIVFRVGRVGEYEKRPKREWGGAGATLKEDPNNKGCVEGNKEKGWKG